MEKINNKNSGRKKLTKEQLEFDGQPRGMGRERLVLTRYLRLLKVRHSIVIYIQDIREQLRVSILCKILLIVSGIAVYLIVELMLIIMNLDKNEGE